MRARLPSLLSTLALAAGGLLGLGTSGCDDRPQLSVEPEAAFSPDTAPDGEPDDAQDAGGATTTTDAGVTDDTGGVDVDGGAVDGGAADAGLSLVPPSDACATYLACLTAIDPTVVTEEVLGAFGPGGLCWVNGPEVADFCDVQCRAELGYAQDYVEYFPECEFAGAIPPPAPDAGIFDAGNVIDAGIFDAGNAFDAGNFVDAGGNSSTGGGNAGQDAGGGGDSGPTSDAGFGRDAGIIDAGGSTDAGT